MPSSPNKSPKDALSVVRKGDTVRLTATVTRVADDNPSLRKVTVTIPGYPIPLSEASFEPADD